MQHMEGISDICVRYATKVCGFTSNCRHFVSHLSCHMRNGMSRCIKQKSSNPDSTDCLWLGALNFNVLSKWPIFTKLALSFIQWQVAPMSFFGAFENFRKATVSVIVHVRRFVRPYGTSRLPVDGIWRVLVYEFFFFSKVFLENSGFVAGTYFTWRPAYIYDRVSQN